MMVNDSRHTWQRLRNRWQLSCDQTLCNSINTVLNFQIGTATICPRIHRSRRKNCLRCITQSCLPFLSIQVWCIPDITKCTALTCTTQPMKTYIGISEESTLVREFACPQWKCNFTIKNEWKITALNPDDTPCIRLEKKNQMVTP